MRGVTPKQVVAFKRGDKLFSIGSCQRLDRWLGRIFPDDPVNSAMPPVSVRIDVCVTPAPLCIIAAAPLTGRGVVLNYKVILLLYLVCPL